MNPYYRPVCGNDMKTYGNKDILDCFNRQRPRNRRKYEKKKEREKSFEKILVASIKNSSSNGLNFVTIDLLYIYVDHES